MGNDFSAIRVYYYRWSKRTISLEPKWTSWYGIADDIDGHNQISRTLQACPTWPL